MTQIKATKRNKSESEEFALKNIDNEKYLDKIGREVVKLLKDHEKMSDIFIMEHLRHYPTWVVGAALMRLKQKIKSR